MTLSVSAVHPADPAEQPTYPFENPALLRELAAALRQQHNPFWISDGRVISCRDGEHPFQAGLPGRAVYCPSTLPEHLGDPAFRQTYGTRYALYGGSMANGISSEEMVIALGKAGLMGSFGAGGCLPARVEKAIHAIREALGDLPFCFNLINSPYEPALETRTTDLYLQHGIRVIEASAYLSLTKNLVRYRAAGLSQNPDGSVRIRNRIIAKVSRKEVAGKFLQPADPALISQLLEEGCFGEETARLLPRVPMADDV
ncbi:MAG: 2-nitropropane dioxygenase, partial [Anaerolineaceae bacterium]